MFNRIKKFLRIRLGKISREELTLEACLRRGMKVGGNCHGLTGSTIDYAHCWLIEIGNNVTFAPQVYLLAHDASTKRYLNYTKIAKIKIEDNVFIGARSLIMPGVIVGENAIVAAGSVVTKSVSAGHIVGGNPAKVLGKTEDYINKHRLNMETAHVYDRSWTIDENITLNMGIKMERELGHAVGYVE